MDSANQNPLSLGEKIYVALLDSSNNLQYQTIANPSKEEKSALSALRDLRQDNVAAHIEEGLFLGSARAAANKEGLKSLNVTHILTVATSLSPAHPNDFTYKIVEVSDSEDTNLAKYFHECFDFIDEAKKTGGAVLVHCHAGISRSVTIVLAYLMNRHGIPLSDAVKHVKAKRPKARPNPGFLKQLMEFEKPLQGAQEDLMNID
ncbi:Dual specificity protein phosphatase 1-like protein [Drosera capensis]